MHGLLDRTSITEDEAVWILLDQATGPIEYESIGDDADADANRPVFCLREALELAFDERDREYRLAIEERQSGDVIAKKLSALNGHGEMVEQANVHLCAIRDELNKGERSVLKVDSALSNAAYTYITQHSFHEWVKSNSAERMAGQTNAAVPAELMLAPNLGEKKQILRRRQLDQEEAILAAIRERYDPMALPNFVSGKEGVRAEIREALRASPLFKGSTVFDKAWERLSKQKATAYQSDRPPPKKSVGDTTEGG